MFMPPDPLRQRCSPSGDSRMTMAIRQRPKRCNDLHMLSASLLALAGDPPNVVHEPPCLRSVRTGSPAVFPQEAASAVAV